MSWAAAKAFRFGGRKKADRVGGQVGAYPKTSLELRQNPTKAAW